LTRNYRRGIDVDVSVHRGSSVKAGKRGQNDHPKKKNPQKIMGVRCE
jgi:hypothetical protein